MEYSFECIDEKTGEPFGFAIRNVEFGNTGVSYNLQSSVAQGAFFEEILVVPQNSSGLHIPLYYFAKQPKSFTPYNVARFFPGLGHNSFEVRTQVMYVLEGLFNRPDFDQGRAVCLNEGYIISTLDSYMSMRDGGFSRMSLSHSQVRFFEMLGDMAYLLPLFDIDKGEHDAQAVDGFLRATSPARAIMARFMLGIWLGQNEYRFDLIDAAKVLGPDSLGVIQKWVNDPFYP